MGTLTLRLPESIHKKIKELAKTEGISINQFLASAASEKIAVLLTKDYLEEEAKRGKRDDFDKVMKTVPSVEPEEYDKLISNKR